MDFSAKSGHEHLVRHRLGFWFLLSSLPTYRETSPTVSCGDALWETMSRNNVVTEHPRGVFLHIPSQQMAIGHWEMPRINRKRAQSVPSHKVQLQNVSSPQIPSHKLSVTWIIIILQNSCSRMETGIYFLLLAFVTEYSKFTHKILCGHNKLIASNVILSSCTADYFSTERSSGITTNPQGTELKRYPTIMNL